MATLHKADLAPLALLELGGGRSVAALTARGATPDANRLVLGDLPEDEDRPPIVLPLADARALAALVAAIGEVFDRDEPVPGVSVGLAGGAYLTALFMPAIAIGLHVGDEMRGMITCQPAELPRVAAFLVQVAREITRPSAAPVH